MPPRPAGRRRRPAAVETTLVHTHVPSETGPNEPVPPEQTLPEPQAEPVSAEQTQTLLGELEELLKIDFPPAPPEPILSEPPLKNELVSPELESRKSIIIKPEEVPVRPDVLNIAHLPPVEKELNSKYSRVTQQEAEALLAWIESSKESEPLAVPEKLDVPKPAEKATERSSRFDSIKKTFRGAYERFISRFKGEVQPEDEKGAEKRWGDVAKNAATGFLSVVATYTGAKLVADLPQWLYQKYWTNPAERQRIKEALASKEKETDETAEPTIIDQKKARLEEAIHASKFLTAEKKLELLAKLKDTVETYEKEEKALRTERDQKIAQLLDEAIQTRVKNTVVLKEALNSALMVTGLSAMRGVAYGSVSLYERYKEVSQERREGKRTGGQFNEWIVKGVTETAHKLVGGGAETWIGKGMNVVQGATTVLRAAGFTELAISEYMNEGGSKLIETSLKAFEQKGMLEAAKANIAAPWERLGHGTQWIREKTMGTPSATETPSGTVLSEKPITETTKAAPAEPVAPEGAATGMAAGELARAAHETFGETEFSEAQIELGTVKPGDGIVELMERQGVHPDEALRTAREAGIVRGGGDTRLTTEAIYRISVLAKMTPDGHAMISFIDKTTGSELSLEDLREQGLVREHGTVPGEIATHSEKIQATMERGSSVRLETGPGPEASLEVPHKLSGGRLELFTKNGRLTSMDTGIDRLTPDEKALIKNLFEKIPNKNEKVAESIDLFISGTTRRIQETVSLEALLTRLEEKGFGDSIEAQMVRNTLLGNQESFKWMGPGILHEEKLANIANEKVRLNTTLLEKGVPEADRIGDIRIRGLGKVEFLYDADGKPSLDWKKLTEEAGRSLQKRASSLLVEGWEGTLRNAVLVEMNTVVEKQQLQIGGKLLLMHEALRELETEKHGNSPEAQYIREQMKTFLIKNGAALDQDNILLKEMIKESGAQNRMPIAIPAPERVDHAISPVAVQDTEEIHEPLKAFKSDAGKVKFSYNPDGSVDDAYIPAYTPKREAVERALADWGLTKDQVKQYFFDRRGGLWEPSERGTGAYVGTSQSHLDTSARGMSERLIKDVERLARQEATLVAMEKAGLQTTPEYQYWRQETTEFRQYVRKELKPLIPRTV